MHLFILVIFAVLLGCSPDQQVAGGEDFPNSIDPITASIRKELARGDSGLNLNVGVSTPQNAKSQALARSFSTLASVWSYSIDTLQKKIYQIKRDSFSVLNQTYYREDTLVWLFKNSVADSTKQLSIFKNSTWTLAGPYEEQKFVDIDGDQFILDQSRDSNALEIQQKKWRVFSFQEERIGMAAFKDTTRNYPLYYYLRELFRDSSLNRIQALSSRNPSAALATDTINYDLYHYKLWRDSVQAMQEAHYQLKGFGDNANILSYLFKTRKSSAEEDSVQLKITPKVATPSKMRVTAGLIQAIIYRKENIYTFNGEFNPDSLWGDLTLQNGAKRIIRSKR